MFSLVSLDFTEGLVKITIDTKRRNGCDRYKKKLIMPALPFEGKKNLIKKVEGISDTGVLIAYILLC